MDDLKIVIVGHVDHGKSTLIGRLLADTNSLKDNSLNKVKKQCELKGKQFEYAFLLDALQEEQEQGVTIDITLTEFSTKKRKYTIIDAPGHKQFLKNMISGASNAEAAILLVDANEGVKDQTKRHALMLSILGIKQVIVIINKMDLVNYSESVYEKVKTDLSNYLDKLNIFPKYFIPIQATLGYNIIGKSKVMNWYQGLNVISAIDKLISYKTLDQLPLRMPIQDIYKFDSKRIIAGRIETGEISENDKIIILPDNYKTKVKKIDNWLLKDNKKTVTPEYNVGLILEDEYYHKRGNMIIKSGEKPNIKNYFKSKIFWMGNKPLITNKKYKIKLNTQSEECEIQTIISVINSESLLSLPKNMIQKNEVGEVFIKTKNPLIFDNFEKIHSTGRFVIVEDSIVAGGGIILPSEEFNKSKNDEVYWHQNYITKNDRNKLFGINNKVIWFTGLSGSGKSTISYLLEKKLYEKGFPAYTLDGDNIRHGINSNLGFSDQDRKENIRRVKEVTKLFYDSGMFTLVSFISPFTKGRNQVRELFGEDFVEVYVNCPLEECELRDVKGLYKKARQGIIKEFTGISSSYEIPKNPEIIINTKNDSPEICVEKILKFLKL